MLFRAIQDVLQVLVPAENDVVRKTIHLKQPPLVDDSFKVQLKFGPDAFQPLHLVLTGSEPACAARLHGIYERG
ncbi:MAG TPA: hypothetical protein PKD58_03785, partial [Candidatus Sumerlaeota bacterium]|nr:hypothetical protein [Candidatus Sumerlaeota bacterium]